MAREYKDSANREHSYAGINYAEEQPVLERKLKDSGIEWIGKVPSDWKTEKAKHVFVQRREKGNEDCTLLAATQKYGMYPQHLLEGVVKVSSDTDMQQFKTVHINDYVISLRSFQGGFELSNYEGVCSPAYQVFSAHKAINNIFFKYLFKSDAFIQQINAFVLGIREGKNIQYDDFSTMYLPIPSLDEQQRIADFLDEKCGEIDKLVALQEQMIEELKAYKQSVITEAVTKGLNPDVEFVPSGIDWIGDVPKGWYIVALRYLFTIKAGGDAKPELYSDTLDLLHPYPVYTNTLDATQVYAYTSLPVFKGNSITVTGRGAVGHAIYRKNDYDAIIRLLSLSPKCYAVDCRYYAYYIDNVLHIFTNNAAIAQLSTEQLAPYKVLLPSLVEQRTISSYLDTKSAEIDSLIDMKQQKIESLKEYKKSIIFEYVTGKKQVV